MNRAEFQIAFAAALSALAQSEQTTKAQLKELSRSLLSAIHGVEDEKLSGDIQFINQTLAVLTPMNRRTAVLFFKEFAGFHYDEKDEVFTKKMAKGAVETRKRAIEFLEDVNQNIWTWAERNVRVEAKPFKISKLTKDVEKAIEEGISQEDILQAIFEGGINVAAVVLMLEEIAKENADLGQ